ncbi:glycosyl transferase group 1 [Crinalium epipsammum PCC 9333]|uniref:Glycosyl transferase group 1 n=1 Tax=Crinalium epipsammum PCC 9333 TaxID=1173022 RepID=K9W1S3_9CYAN|nr:glycosyltransferase [Crinalium epipsammum]AFZ14318.1 glycosyl transferase group 1 [Crinalium epipsammum PCC 9333]
MKIVFLIRSLNQGGAERQLVTLAKALKKENFNVTILCFYSGGILAKDLENTEVKLISLEKQHRWDVLSFLWRLYREIKGLNPDILHGYLDSGNLLATFLKPALPTTRIFWGVRASNVDLTRYSWLSRVLYRLECFCSRLPDLIIVNSHAGQAYHLAHGFPADKMVVIPNGIDTEKFKPNPNARTKIRSEWGIPANTILIGLVGRLDPMKDYPTFLKAAALLCQVRQDVVFVCIGGGLENYAREMHQLANQLEISEKVIWAGARADVPDVYNALDIAVSSSSYGEGFPNVIGEAMATGVPCVVTDVGDSAWIVGETGIVVPPKNPEALVKGWLVCLEIDKIQIREQARLRIVNNFSIQKLVAQTKAVLWLKV